VKGTERAAIFTAPKNSEQNSKGLAVVNKLDSKEAAYSHRNSIEGKCYLSFRPVNDILEYYKHNEEQIINTEKCPYLW
jgi:hypothetical protein